MSSGGSKRPEDTDFKQQRLPAWQPLLTPKWVISTFAIIGLVFLPIGIVILVTSNNVVEVRRRYDDKCAGVFNLSGDGALCNISFSVPERMNAPIYFYYELTNFYQNHRRYVKSRSDEQLRGDDLNAVGECSPMQTSHLNVSGEQVSRSLNLVPCGLIAFSFFTDTFEAAYDGGDLGGSDWNGKGIAWDSDRKEKFKRVDLDVEEQTNRAPLDDMPGGKKLPDVDNEDFIVWMRTAGLPTFKKLYRKIENQDFERGKNVVVHIRNQFPVSEFDGEKRFVFSTTSWLGGKNDFLGWAYIVVGSLCLLLAAIFEIKHYKNPRRLGDMQYFHWSGAGKAMPEEVGSG